MKKTFKNKHYPYGYSYRNDIKILESFNFSGFLGCVVWIGLTGLYSSAIYVHNIDPGCTAVLADFLEDMQQAFTIEMQNEYAEMHSKWFLKFSAERFGPPSSGWKWNTLEWWNTDCLDMTHEPYSAQFCGDCIKCRFSNFRGLGHRIDGFCPTMYLMNVGHYFIEISPTLRDQYLEVFELANETLDVLIELKEQGWVIMDSYLGTFEFDINHGLQRYKDAIMKVQDLYCEDSHIWARYQKINTALSFYDINASNGPPSRLLNINSETTRQAIANSPILTAVAQKEAELMTSFHETQIKILNEVVRGEHTFPLTEPFGHSNDPRNFFW